MDDQSEVLVLISYHSIGTYELYSSIEDKLVISKYGLKTKAKGGIRVEVQFDKNQIPAQLCSKKMNKMKLR